MPHTTRKLIHPKLLNVIPDEHLRWQWLDCLGIKKEWEKGLLYDVTNRNNYITKYSRMTFLMYVNKVIKEMDKRGMKWRIQFYEPLKSFCEEEEVDNKYRELSYKEHDYAYLIRCYYEMEYEYEHGRVTENEMKLLKGFYNIHIKNDIEYPVEEEIDLETYGK